MTCSNQRVFCFTAENEAFTTQGGAEAAPLAPGGCDWSRLQFCRHPGAELAPVVPDTSDRLLNYQQGPQ